MSTAIAKGDFNEVHLDLCQIWQ